MPRNPAWRDLADRLMVTLEPIAACADEMTCALPAARLGEIVAAVEAATDLDRAMARYASADAQRFDTKA